MSEESQVTDDTTVDDQSTVLGGDDKVTDTQVVDDKVTDDKVDDKTDDKTDDKPGEVPEAYEFTMPDGMELDQAAADAFTPLLQKHNITQEGADELTEAYASIRQAEAKANADAFVAQLDDWGKELKSDKEFGGDGFDENASETFKFIEKTMPDELKEHLLGPEGLFDKTGIGQHPALVKYFFHLSKKFPVKEDDPGSGNAGGSETTPEQRMYPKEAATG